MTGSSAPRTSASVGRGIPGPGGCGKGARFLQVRDEEGDVRREGQERDREKGGRRAQLARAAAEERDGQPNRRDAEEDEAGHLEALGGEIRELRERSEARAARIDGLPHEERENLRENSHDGLQHPASQQEESVHPGQAQREKGSLPDAERNENAHESRGEEVRIR